MEYTPERKVCDLALRNKIIIKIQNKLSCVAHSHFLDQSTAADIIFFFALYELIIKFTTLIFYFKGMYLVWPSPVSHSFIVQFFLIFYQRKKSILSIHNTWRKYEKMSFLFASLNSVLFFLKKTSKWKE